MATEHPTITRFRDELTRLGGRGEVVILPDSVHTAALAAEALGCEVGAIANSVVFDCDGEPLLGMASGAHRVDTELLARALGATAINKAAPQFVRSATDQVIGGVAPTGHPTRLRTVVDNTLATYPIIWTAAGTADSVMSMTYEQLLVITDGVAMPVR
jgi:prolyl-tRNA editing enzyme YbaK/EbsC (Cys-tRNA(Pro) deacylase)